MNRQKFIKSLNCILTFSSLMRLFISQETRHTGTHEEMKPQVTSWTAI